MLVFGDAAGAAAGAEGGAEPRLAAPGLWETGFVSDVPLEQPESSNIKIITAPNTDGIDFMV
jgi:hypothetical protein